MCDTFIALPPATKDGSVIFAKTATARLAKYRVSVFTPAPATRRGRSFNAPT